MNKKQLLVAWGMGLSVCLAVLFTPKMTTWKEGLLILRKDQGFLAPLVNWSLVCAYSLVIIIIGCLLIYSLKEKTNKKNFSEKK